MKPHHSTVPKRTPSVRTQRKLAYGLVRQRTHAVYIYKGIGDERLNAERELLEAVKQYAATFDAPGRAPDEYAWALLRMALFVPFGCLAYRALIRHLADVRVPLGEGL